MHFLNVIFLDTIIYIYNVRIILVQYANKYFILKKNNDGEHTILYKISYMNVDIFSILFRLFVRRRR